MLCRTLSGAGSGDVGWLLYRWLLHDGCTTLAERIVKLLQRLNALQRNILDVPGCVGWVVISCVDSIVMA